MSNCTWDNDIVLDNLGVDEERRLKCTAHIILGIDDALPNVFKSSEEKVGRKILVVGELGQKVLHGTTSMVMSQPAPCNIKGELHSDSWNLTFIIKLQFPLILWFLFSKYQKIDNCSWDIYVFSHTETCFYTYSE